MTTDIINGEKFEFFPVLPAAELPKGERRFLDIDGIPIMLLNHQGSIIAISDLCSHDNGPLGDGEVDGEVITCPRHGARFNLKTGKALSLPAVENIPVFPTRIRNDQIEIGIKTR
jgi:3-phenylpropionate/trans-cinnamate dioxygenase ferredoxin subunit